jgi:UDP-MurNAc hydroxylase
MRVTYYGQACTMIEAAGRRLLTDPWLTEGAYGGTWFHTHVLAEAGVTPETIRKDVDYIFLSHEHQDHLDPATLKHFPKDVPVLICRFPTRKFRHHLEEIGLTNIQELASGEPRNLGDGLEVTIFGSAEYTNDAAILVTAEGHCVFNETDCKLGYRELEMLRDRNIDIGFFMFSGANWYPMLYENPADAKLEQVRRRRRLLLKGFVERVRLTRPRIAVPSAGPCTILDPDLRWLNSKELGIFIDPEDAVTAIKASGLPTEGVNMAATDVWDSTRGIERHAPPAFRLPRDQYLEEAAGRWADAIRLRKAAEPPAKSDLPTLVPLHFERLIAALTPAIRARIASKIGLHVTGPHGGSWTLDFTRRSAPFVEEGLAADWTYRIEAEDKLIYPFVSGAEPFLEDLFLSMRVNLARRPDVYNEPLYHFLYEPDPGKLQDWYAAH